jgi:hypothetical protein
VITGVRRAWITSISGVTRSNGEGRACSTITLSARGCLPRRRRSSGNPMVAESLLLR